MSAGGQVVAVTALMISDHVAVRVPDFEVGKQWFVEKLDFRIAYGAILNRG